MDMGEIFSAIKKENSFTMTALFNGVREEMCVCEKFFRQREKKKESEREVFQIFL